jgi:hypothetical protein
MSVRAAVWALLWIGAAGAGWYAWEVKGWRPPPHWNPMAPLQIAEQPGWFTRMKLDRLDRDPQQCLATLSGSAFRFEPIDDRTTGPGCGFSNAVRVSRTSVALSGPFTLSCPAAVSLALWERHSLQFAAQRNLERSVTRIDHLGSYACRNVYGREVGRRSQHATADALDIAGFRLEDGSSVRVLGDWRDADSTRGDTPKARFLRDARNGACRFFDTVLSPDYNAAHADHLHLDRGRYQVCR